MADPLWAFLYCIPFLLISLLGIVNITCLLVAFCTETKKNKLNYPFPYSVVISRTILCVIGSIFSSLFINIMFSTMPMDTQYLSQIGMEKYEENKQNFATNERLAFNLLRGETENFGYPEYETFKAKLSATIPANKTVTGEQIAHAIHPYFMQCLADRQQNTIKNLKTYKAIDESIKENNKDCADLAGQKIIEDKVLK